MSLSCAARVSALSILAATTLLAGCKHISALPALGYGYPAPFRANRPQLMTEQAPLGENRVCRTGQVTVAISSVTQQGDELLIEGTLTTSLSKVRVGLMRTHITGLSPGGARMACRAVSLGNVTDKGHPVIEMVAGNDYPFAIRIGCNSRLTTLPELTAGFNIDGHWQSLRFSNLTIDN